MHFWGVGAELPLAYHEYESLRSLNSHYAASRGKLEQDTARAKLQCYTAQLYLEQKIKFIVKRFKSIKGSSLEQLVSIWGGLGVSMPFLCWNGSVVSENHGLWISSCM